MISDACRKIMQFVSYEREAFGRLNAAYWPNKQAQTMQENILAAKNICHLEFILFIFNF